MMRVFALFSSLMLALLNLLMPFLPQCTSCDSTGYVICDNCNGKGLTYSDEWDLMVSCEGCEGRGESYCPDCPENMQSFYLFKTEMEKGN